MPVSSAPPPGVTCARRSSAPDWPGSGRLSLCCRSHRRSVFCLFPEPAKALPDASGYPGSPSGRADSHHHRFPSFGSGAGLTASRRYAMLTRAGRSCSSFRAGDDLSRRMPRVTKRRLPISAVSRSQADHCRPACAKGSGSTQAGQRSLSRAGCQSAACPGPKTGTRKPPALGTFLLRLTRAGDTLDAPGRGDRVHPPRLPLAR